MYFCVTVGENLFTSIEEDVAPGRDPDPWDRQK